MSRRSRNGAFAATDSAAERVVRLETVRKFWSPAQSRCPAGASGVALQARERPSRALWAYSSAGGARCLFVLPVMGCRLETEWNFQKRASGAPASAPLGVGRARPGGFELNGRLSGRNPHCCRPEFRAAFGIQPMRSRSGNSRFCPDPALDCTRRACCQPTKNGTFTRCASSVSSSSLRSAHRSRVRMHE